MSEREQVQRSVTDQLTELCGYAVRKGMYDAADWINRRMWRAAPEPTAEPEGTVRDSGGVGAGSVSVILLKQAARRIREGVPIGKPHAVACEEAAKTLTMLGNLPLATRPPSEALRGAFGDADSDRFRQVVRYAVNTQRLHDDEPVLEAYAESPIVEEIVDWLRARWLARTDATEPEPDIDPTGLAEVLDTVAEEAETAAMEAGYVDDPDATAEVSTAWLVQVASVCRDAKRAIGSDSEEDSEPVKGWRI